MVKRIVILSLLILGANVIANRLQTNYYVQVLALDGSVIAQPLDVAGVTFTPTLYIANSNQNQIGTFTLVLHDAWRDITAMHLRDTYDLLDYEQRVEIYDNKEMLGDPVFTGVITALPQDLEGQPNVEGQDILRRIATRKLPRYYEVNENAATFAERMLKTYDVTLKDNFDTGSFSPNWEYSGGGTGVGWSLVADARGGYYVQKLNTNAGSGSLRTVNTFTSAQWRNSWVSFDYKLTKTLSSGVYEDEVEFAIVETGGNGFELMIYQLNDNTIVVSTSDQALTLTTLYRFMLMPVDQWTHVDLYFSDTGTVLVYLNGLQAIVDDRLTFGDHTAYLRFSRQFALGAATYYDNFLFASATPRLTAGTFDATSETLEQTFNRDNQLAALQFAANYLDWEYRVNPKAGEGNDTLDFGASLGYDYTTDANNRLELVEGQNIVSLRQSRASDILATSLYVYGQSQDEGSSNFIVNSFDGIDNYGIIEDDYSDQRIVDTATAQLLGNNRLGITAAGNVSLSGRIVDESALFERVAGTYVYPSEQPANVLVWDVGTWDDKVWGVDPSSETVTGVQRRLRVGDYVWLKSKKLGIDKKVRIVALTRTSGSPGLDVVFDFFPWRRGDEIKRLRSQISILTRAQINRLNAQNNRFVFATTGTQYWYPYLRGQIKSTLIDITTSGGSPTYKVLLDSTDVTSALFGAASLTTSAHAVDDTYFKFAGSHTLAIQVTSGSGTFDVVIQTQGLS